LKTLTLLTALNFCTFLIALLVGSFGIAFARSSFFRTIVFFV
jgi:hypothetical protein